jgi:hypothetical protein
MPLRLEDLDHATVLTVLDGLPDVFRTKDVSEPAAELDAHVLLSAEQQYHAVLGKYLRKHGPTLGVELVSAAAHPRGVLWRKVPAVEPTASDETRPSAGGLSRPVRSGHERSLDYMQSNAFREVKDLLDARPEIGGVYFRPLEQGVCMVDLHPESPKPRIGIGTDPLLRRGTTAAQLGLSLPGRIAYLQGKRAEQQTPSRENQLEAQLIRDAQANNLRLPAPFPSSLRFVHSQWRVDNPWPGASQRFTDLIAVDLTTAGLVIIELKAPAGPDRRRPGARLYGLLSGARGGAHTLLHAGGPGDGGPVRLPRAGTHQSRSGTGGCNDGLARRLQADSIDRCDRSTPDSVRWVSCSGLEHVGEGHQRRGAAVGGHARDHREGGLGSSDVVSNGFSAPNGSRLTRTALPTGNGRAV